MEKKIVFFDIDGTLASGYANVPESGLNAMRAAQKNGALCFVATGRPLGHVVRPVREAGFDGFVCSCGQSLYIGGETVYRLKADRALSRKIADKAYECRLDGFYEAEEGVWGIYTGLAGGDMETELRLFEKGGLPVYRSLDEGDFFFDKFCVWEHEGSRREEFEAFISPWYTSTGGEGTLHEYVWNGRSKQEGAKDVFARYGIKKENAYAIGDGVNDVPTFLLCAHTAAMGNGDERLKRVASYITDSVLNDGVEKALAYWNLI